MWYMNDILPLIANRCIRSLGLESCMTAEIIFAFKIDFCLFLFVRTKYMCWKYASLQLNNLYQKVFLEDKNQSILQKVVNQDLFSAKPTFDSL